MTSLIIDTNVVVSGLITGDAGSPPARLLDAMLTDQVRCVVSEELLSEYRAVLLRPAIARRHGLCEAEVDTILTRLALSCAVRTPSAATTGAPDPGDAHLWALLEAEPEAVLVTGDRRLLESAPRGRRVVTPARALEELLAG